MKDWTTDPQQVELFWRRSQAAGVNRREFLKILAAAAGSSVVTAIHGSMATQIAAAAPATPGLRAVPDAEQVFRTPWGTDPASHDFNRDLYCDGLTELFAGLTRFDTDYKPVPYVAERWETKFDGAVYIFYLKRGLKWTNGDPVTARDFEWSFKRQLDPETKASYAAFLFDIKNAEEFNTRKGGVTRDMLGLKVIDDYTLLINLEGPRGYFLTVMAYTAALPAHRPSVEKHGDKWTEAANIVTNGPWKLTAWEHNRRMIFERNEDFALRPKPRLKKIIAPIIAAGLPAYEAGEIDRAGVPLTEIRRLQNDPRLSKELHLFSLTGTYYLAPSYKTPPFDHRGVRRALAHAIDRAAIVRTILQGFGQPAFTFVPPDSPGHLDPSKYPWIRELTEYNPRQAMDMLKGTPYEGGRNWPKVSITFRRDEGVAPTLAVQAIQAMLKDSLNLAVELEGLEGRVFRSRMWEHRNQLNFVRWIMDYPDPNNNLFLVWYSKRTGGSRHEYKDDEFDRLVDEAAEAPTFERRMELYARAERRMLEDGAAIYIYYPFGARVYKPWVQGLPKNSAGLPVQDFNIYFGLLNQIFIAEHPDRPRLR